jgi:hypothetical protein
MKSHYTDREYYDDSVLLDGLYEFHPEFFQMLQANEWRDLRAFYLTGQQHIPADVSRYRSECLYRDPTIEVKARQALKKVRQLAGMSSGTP